MYVDVIINRRVAAVDKVFTYTAPEELAHSVGLGTLLRVPFNHETLEAVAVGFPAAPPAGLKLRAIKEVAAAQPLLPPDLLALARWLADYYLCPWVTAMQAMLPAGLLLSGRLPQTLYRNVYSAPPLPAEEILTPKQRLLYSFVAGSPLPCSRAKIEEGGFSAAMLRALVKRGALIKSRQRIEESGAPYTTEAGELSPEQQAVYRDILNEWQNKKRPYLLFGITGSGKTELYLRLILDMLAAGLQSIVLTPEIALSGQMLEMLRRRLPCRIEVLHSGLTSAERRQVWQDIAAGQVQVVVGARSAVFAPAPRLGLIVLDEEHEASYKQDNTPRFHARAIALERCRLSGARLLLGSATPAVESYWAAKKGDYALGWLRRHYHPAPAPLVEVVDMRGELRRGNRSIFSLSLQTAVGQALEQGEQAILFLNRRGYYQFFSCRSCGAAITCPHCNVAMGYHQTAQGGHLKCHYCGRALRPMSVCPACGSRHIRSFGVGTQRVEAELAELFPKARILRLDSDALSERGEHARIYQAMLEGQADILVGTQMVAKGLDFPLVSVAAALAADSLLNLPDWRAAERAYQLLSQLCGRAGRRAKQGLAIIQTYTPQALAVTAAASQDYEGFFAAELQTRRLHAYPPAGYLLRVLLAGPTEARVARAARLLAHYIKPQLPPAAELCGPSAAPLERVKDRWRWHIILKGPELTPLSQAAAEGLRRWRQEERPLSDVNVQVDVEPFNML
jgi:primosomal protein N' (replication factor Y)